MKTVVDLVTSLKTFFLGKDTLIESSIAPVEANPADSSRAYTIGKRLYIENVLYKVTAPIAIHDALVEGTNIEVADDITTQLDSIPDMTGATSLADGAHGFVPAPQAGDEAKVLKGDGTWESALTGVNLTNLANKDVLRYNSTSQKWENDQLNDKADKTDLTSIIATGATNTTGAPITDGTYFYKDGVMSRAIANIAENATFTLNTNYENVPTGALNDIASKLQVEDVTSDFSTATTAMAAVTELSAQKCGKIITLMARITAPSTVTGDPVICTFPAKYNPATVKYFGVAMKMWTANGNTGYMINNGVISLTSSGYEASARYVLTATWIIK